jgi:hypothetical protein
VEEKKRAGNVNAATKNTVGARKFHGDALEGRWRKELNVLGLLTLNQLTLN